MELHDTAAVLTRVLTSGVLMSIEKNDRELPGLQRILEKLTRRPHSVLVNSRTAAVHTALAGQGVGHGDEITQPGLDQKTTAFLAWLGISVRDTDPATFAQIGLDHANLDRLPELASAARAPALIVDMTGLGFGPAAAVLGDDATAWARGERLKIFGAFDLRTMWTQEEADPHLVPGVQFNYRLSPMVAACLRMALSRTVRSAGAAP
ncbi:DegT/DnrJ/EryC1/StrS family aminotransferase [Nocardia sp. NPDC127526]|uniref:DegT/DnrJ/EryC1/StrS family aminotransferase n=1 Tax=Nocardia sp. NPDC127526 TaxID=3345393 RepID=UPI003643BDCD